MLNGKIYLCLNPLDICICGDIDIKAKGNFLRIDLVCRRYLVTNYVP